MLNDSERDEFNEFLAATPVAPPDHTSKQIFTRIRRDLEPSPARVSLKIYATGLIVGLASMFVCPQFGLGFGPFGHLLHGIFMAYGDKVCAATCGALFLLITTSAGLLVLTPAERRIARTRALFQSLAMTMGFLVLFKILGAEVALDLAVLWLGAAVLSGFAVLSCNPMGRGTEARAP